MEGVRRRLYDAPQGGGEVKDAGGRKGGRNDPARPAHGENQSRSSINQGEPGFVVAGKRTLSIQAASLPEDIEPSF